MRIMLNDSRFAQSGNQTERKASTSSQETAALRAATFILITTISPVASGRTATNGESDKSRDQKSGLENPLPAAAATITGIARVQARIHKVVPRSSRRCQETGPMTSTSIAPIESGNSQPMRRHSNQN